MKRIKSYYEDRYRFYLLRRTPVIIRLDGRVFHSLTSQCVKPFDMHFDRGDRKNRLAEGRGKRIELAFAPALHQIDMLSIQDIINK